MKTKLLHLVMFLLFSGTIAAQDTIFVKSGDIIPAVIVEKNNTEVKYRKPGQAASPAIYSVFVSDILSIHYSNGIVADYSQAGQDNGKPVKPIENAGKMKVVRIGIEPTVDYFMKTPGDLLLKFWRYWALDSKATIGGNPVSIPLNLKVNFVIGNSGRFWMGDELQLMITPSDAISASTTNINGLEEIKLGMFYYNITIDAGHTLNHKRTLAAILEPGLDVSFMRGHITLVDKEYKTSLCVGLGYHCAVGLDWLITKRISLSTRVGYRSVNIKEQHIDKDSNTGYSYFYVVPVTDKRRLTVGWQGAYASVGVAYNMYYKLMKGIQLER